MRKRKQCGLGNTFCPGLLKENQAAESTQQECWNLYCSSLRNSGFEQIDGNSNEKHWSLAISVSSSFEIDWRLDHSLRTVSLNERPLSWVHATLIADRCHDKGEKSDLLRSHDIRFKVETTEPIQQGSKPLSLTKLQFGRLFQNVSVVGAKLHCT